MSEGKKNNKEPKFINISNNKGLNLDISNKTAELLASTSQKIKLPSGHVVSFGEDKDLMEEEDTTSAKSPREVRKNEYDYNPTMPGLLEQYILKYLPVPSLIAIIVFGYIYVQDNNYGRLQNWEGIFWAIGKAGFFLAITFLFYLIPNIINKIIRKK